MASSGPQHPLGSAPHPSQLPSASDQISWEGDKMFNIYILDYCKKRGYHKTASQLVSEADIAPESKPPINAQQGLLFEWWSVFWVLFQAKNSGSGSEDAIMYHKHQNQMRARAGHVPHPGVAQPPPGRYPLPNGMTGPVPPLPNAQINGIGPVGQPPSLTAPHYGPSNPATHPNGIPPPPAPPGAPGQPFSGVGGVVGRPPLGPQQRIPNGPQQQYHSPTIAPSPQSGGNNSQQQHAGGPMAQLGRSPHMSAMNRTAMPPPNGPQHPQGPGPAAAGSAHPTPTMAYQQLGRPPSSHGTSHPMNPHMSPALGVRMPPSQDRSQMDPQSIDAELATYPPELMGEAKLRAGLGGKDAQSLTQEEKQAIYQQAMRLKQNPQHNSGVPGPSGAGANMHGQMQNRGSMGAQPMQQQLSMQQQRVGKRSSTSPGEEHQTLPRNEQSPSERKRQRRTPNPAEQQQQPPQQQQQQQPQQSQPQPSQAQQQAQQPQQPPQQQQQQPPMAPIGPLPSGPQPMSGAGRGLPMAGAQGPPNAFGPPPMHQIGMAPGHMTPMHTISPGMVHGAPVGVMNPQQMTHPQVLYSQGQYRQQQGLMNAHKHNPGVPVPPVGSGDPQSQGHMRGPMPNRLPGQLGPPQPGQPPKPIGPMLPPGQPGMNGPPKPGGKEGDGDLNTPSSSTPVPLLNNAPPMNPQRPPTASAPLSTPGPGPGSMELPFDMTDMFGNTGGDFDFGADHLAEMELWFDHPVHDGSSLDLK